MADAKDDPENEVSNQDSLQLSFPLPPVAYYKNYTDVNVKNGSVLKPPEVIRGIYSMFGDSFDTNEDIIRPLESQGIPRLYSTDASHDILAEMKKINHSILVNFLELMDVLIDSPLQEEREKKLDDINVLFINLHHLINEFRPHQARETLRVMLHKQRSQRVDTAENLHKHIDKTRSVLRSCHSSLINRSTSPRKPNHIGDIKMEVNTKVHSQPHKNDDVEQNTISLNNKLMCDIVDDFT